MERDLLPIIEAELNELYKALKPITGYQFDVLSIPAEITHVFEPSQIGTLVGTLMDACLSELTQYLNVGLTKHEGILGDREGYPDFKHVSGKRMELKGLYVDNPEINMKKPPTPREPSARLTQKVTLNNVNPHLDAMLLVAYQLQPHKEDPTRYCPTIIDIGVFSMYELVQTRDQRMIESDGMWFGDYDTPTIPSKIGMQKIKRGEPLETSNYGRKEAEGKDLNEDTNFGKLKRIPHLRLQQFLKKHGATYAKRGNRNDPWRLD